MTFSLQTADNSHVPAITEIYGNSVVTHTASFEFDAPDEAEMASRMDAVLAAGYPYLVAVDDDAQQPEILGYAYASAYRSRPGYLWTVEDTVYIAPQARGRGIGTALLSAVIGRCEALGFRQMIAIIGGSDHVASIRLHEKLRFERVGVLPATGFKHGRWLDSVFLQRALGDGADTQADPKAYPGTLYNRETSG